MLHRSTKSSICYGRFSYLADVSLSLLGIASTFVSRTRFRTGAVFVFERLQETNRNVRKSSARGAKNVPVVEPDASGRMQLNPRSVEIVEASFGKVVKCITGCQKGGRSIKAAQLLLVAGFSHVLDMRGGFGRETDEMGRVTFPGWSLRGFPATRESAPEDRYENLAKK